MNIEKDVLLGVSKNEYVYLTFVRDGEYYRLLTSMFMHGNIFHIAFNMYALYILGPQLESFFGKTKFTSLVASINIIFIPATLPYSI